MKNQVFDPLKSGLPCDLPSERMVLSSAMNGSQMPVLRDVLLADDFATEQNSAIWTALCQLHDSGESPDRITLASKLHDAGLLESIGGPSYLCSLDDDWVGVPNLESWVQIVKRKSVKRKAILECNQYMLRLAASSEDESEVFMEASAKMAELNGELVGDTGFSTPADIIRECGGIDKYLDHRRSQGIMTPWSGFNRLTGGFRPEELIIVAAHTARGKTAFALNLAMHAAQHDHPVAVFSMEMAKSMINDRLIAINGRFDGRSLRRPERDLMAEKDREERVITSLRETAQLPLFICDHTTVTVPAIEGKLRRLMARVPISMVVVDYIQLASGVGKFGSRAEEVGSISRGLKRMASSLKIPVIALSQFNRDSARDNREPEKWDLKESGSIEQDANLIIAIHFTRLYDVNAGIPNGDVKIKILKQRNGPEGWLPFSFNAPSGVFYETENS